MQPEKVTVLCGLWAGGIIGSYFFKDAANRNVTVNCERYREMISNYFLPKMQELDLQNMLCQQDTCYTARTTMEASSVNILFHVRDRSIGRQLICPKRSLEKWLFLEF